VQPKCVIAIASALRMESSGLAKLGSFRKEQSGGIKYLKGGIHDMDTAIFVSGVGEEMAYRTAKAACLELQVRAYISIGLSGALSPDIGTGDVVVGECVKTASSGGFGEYRCDPGLLDIAAGAFTEDEMPKIGPLLAVEKVIVASKDKKKLAGAYNCLAVDMESAGAARAAKKAGVPFIAVRAISDELDEDLPVDFNRFTVEGRMDWPCFAFYVATHPGTIGPLIRLGRSSNLAVANLTAILDKVLSGLRASPEFCNTRQ
jgi:adenosylhomocysteine nucleosidase